MKYEFNEKVPEGLKPQWEGQFEIFHWSEYLTGIPMPVFLITTKKENGLSNACFQSWSSFVGDKGGQFCIIGGLVLEVGHTLDLILKTKEFCVNFPTKEYLNHCYRTIENNKDEVDEITESGFTIEESKTINTPRIKECFLNLECTLEWVKPLYEDSKSMIVCGRIKHIAMDDAYFDLSQKGIYNKSGYLMNLRSHVNPLTNEFTDGEIGYINILGDEDESV